MTPRKITSLKAKIVAIKKEMAREKKEWGGQVHDGRGLRYGPPQYYVQLEDFKGAMRYFHWFEKNFPGDMGFPSFLFEWTITLFKTKKLH